MKESLLTKRRPYLASLVSPITMRHQPIISHSHAHPWKQQVEFLCESLLFRLKRSNLCRINDASAFSSSSICRRAGWKRGVSRQLRSSSDTSRNETESRDRTESNRNVERKWMNEIREVTRSELCIFGVVRRRNIRIVEITWTSEIRRYK